MSQNAPRSASGKAEVLKRFGVHDRRRAVLDDAAKLAAKACQAPMAAITLFNDDVEWFIASHGRPGVDSVQLDESPGQYVLRAGTPLVIENAAEDARFRRSPLLNDPAHVRCYAAVPLLAPDKHVAGTLAVMDRVPREIAEHQLCALQGLAARAALDLAIKDATNEYLINSNEIDFHRLFERAPGLFAVFEPREYRIIAANDAYLEATSTRREEIVGKRFDEAFPGDPKDPGSIEGVNNVRTSLDRAKASGKIDNLPVQRYPIPVRGKGDGGFEERYWSISNQPVHDEHGDLRYLVHHVEDITELVRYRRHEDKQHENRRALERRAQKLEAEVERHTQSLKRLNDHLSMAQHVANVGSWQFDARTGERSWSDEMFRIGGVPRGAEEDGIEGILAIVHPDDRENLIAARDRWLSGEVESGEMEHRIIRPDGETRWVRERARAEADENGNVLRIYGTLQDITEQKNAERELENRARQQEAVAALGQRALARIDSQTLWNEAVELCAETLGVEYCKILKLLPDHSGVLLVAGVGWQEGLVGNAVVGIGKDSQAGYTLQSDEPVIVRDLREETRFSGPPLLHEHGVVSGLSVIIRGDRHPWGVLGAHTKQEREFTRDDVNFIQSIANIVSAVAHRTRIEEQLAATARKQRQAAADVQQLAARLTNTLESITDAFFTLDNNWRFSYVNQQAERILQRDREELLGSVVWEQFADTVGSSFYQEYHRAMDEQRTVEFEEFYEPLQIWLSVTAYPSSEGLAVYFRDITDRKRNEAALVESEERFRMVARATADTIWDWNLETDAVWWNEGLRSVFGYSTDKIEADSRSFSTRIHPDDQSRVLGILHEVLDKGENTWGAEYRFRRSDGSYAEVNVRGFVIRDENGRPTRMVGAMNDVTETREYEKRLEQQAALLDKAQDAIIVRDMNDVITFWNKGAERIYGWRADEALGHRKRELLQGDRELYENAAQSLLENGEWSGHIVQSTKSGRELTVEATWTLVTDDHGRPDSVLTIDTDITERLALEEQLRQSQRLEAIGQLTGGVAHDFNNLLTVILGNAELLYDQLGDNARLRRLADMSRVAASRGAELTHRLLAFARRQALEPKVVDVNRLIAETEPLLSRALPETIDLEIALDESIWNAYIDPGQLESTLLNLAINARDAMPDGGRLTIETANAQLDEEYAAQHAEVGAGRYVLIAISDTGTGIPRESLARVFDPFYTTKEKGKGTGLGLSMAYGFAKQSGGHIKLYSELNQGTTVKLYLPRATRPGESCEPEALVEPHLQGSARILVVEDDDLVRNHAESQLRGFGYEVLTASDGAEALEIINRESGIDLLFTDVIMAGGINGRDLAEQAKRIRPSMKVLYTSGYTENAIVHHGRLDPGVHLLQKPYRRADLARKVHQALTGQDSNDH